MARRLKMDEGKYVLLESIRSIFPHLKQFSDDSLERKLASKKLEDCITDFVSYINRDGIKTRNEKLVEGVKLLKLVQHQMLNYQYPATAITPKNVVEGLSLLDDYFYRREQDHARYLRESFPAYASA
jgi:hypothetical protein